MRRARLQPAPGRSSAAASSRARGRRAARTRVNAVLADGSLAITFQPIVALDDGRHVGSEALARFPDLQERPTEEWFADAASVGLQTELELAAVNAALDRLGDLPPYAFMTVNLSPPALLATSVRERFLRTTLQVMLDHDLNSLRSSRGCDPSFDEHGTAEQPFATDALARAERAVYA